MKLLLEAGGEGTRPWEAFLEGAEFIHVVEAPEIQAKVWAT